MQASQTIDSRDGSASTTTTPRRRVIDAPTRMFHWLFALTFIGAYVTAESEHWRLLHVTLGYSFAGLFGFRLLYGLLGPRQVGIGLLVRKLSAGPAWLRSILASRSPFKANWRQGQNLAMALVTALMMSMVVPLALSGYATYNEWGGSFISHLLEEVHEFFGNAFLAVVLTHLGLLALLSVLRRQNQALPMISGWQPGAGPSPVKHNRSWLAALLLFSVLAFGVWHWQTSRAGLAPGLHGESSLDSNPPTKTRADPHHDSDD